MIFSEGNIYHIYNQGNNKGQIFFARQNYLFFLHKISHHILPFADVLAWCMMPNHFHLMVFVRVVERSCETIHPDTTSIQSGNITLNRSLGIMLASYTRAINKQENRSGSLFRKETKAICLNEIIGISPTWFRSDGITYLNIKHPEREYPKVCFNYIHQNPVRAGLVKSPEEWEFSSFADIIGLRNGKLINRTLIREFGLIQE